MIRSVFKKITMTVVQKVGGGPGQESDPKEEMRRA